MNKHAPSQHYARQLAAACIRMDRAERKRAAGSRSERHEALRLIAEREARDEIGSIVFPTRRAQP